MHSSFEGKTSHRYPGRPQTAVLKTIEGGIEVYNRRKHLPRLLPLGPAELADQSEPMCRVILARLARAIRAERARGRAGHWTYDLNRHIALRQAYAAEKGTLRLLIRKTKVPPPRSAGSGT